MYQEEVEEKLRRSELAQTYRKQNDSFLKEINFYKKQIEELQIRLSTQNQSLIDSTANLPQIFSIEETTGRSMSNSGTSSSKLSGFGQVYTRSETIAEREKALVEVLSTMIESETRPSDFRAFLEQAYKTQGERFTEELNRVLEDYKVLQFVTSEVNKELLEFILNVSN